MCAASAYAAGPGPSVSISGYSGNIHGTVSSVSTGSSVVSTQVNGYGSSSQTSFGETGGVAQASGSFSHNGIETVTSTRQYATSDTYGHVSGNAPIMVGDSIANGGATFERPTRTLPPRDRSMRRLSARRRRSKGSEGLATSRVQPLSQRSGRLRPSGQRHHEDHCSCPIPVARGVLSHGADQQRLVVHHVRDLGRDQRRQHARHHVQFKSDASGTLRTAPAMGGQSFYGSFSSDSCMVSAGGAARSSASA